MIRYITVPKDKESEIALDIDQARKDQLIELIMEEDVFKTVWDTGIFNLINMLTGTNIDLYESDSITEASLLAHVVNSGIFESKELNEKVPDLIREIRSLFLNAIKCNTGVYFFF